MYKNQIISHKSVNMVLFMLTIWLIAQVIEIYDRGKCTNLTIVNMDVTKLVQECVSLVTYAEAS